MKQLKKLLLINWHYFWNETIDFQDINFLTGKNAAGKSTIIDALQLLLLGDTNGHFFNKAANEKSSRTLKGYLKGEIGDDGDIGFRYLRTGRFSSYIACEFFDDIKQKSFTLGVVFDCYEDDSDEHRFFVLDSEIPDNGFVHNKIPMSFKDLRSYVLKNYKKGRFEFPDSNRGYQEILKGKLGGLKNKYFSLLKKAVPFTPITNIETFITEYVCDVKGHVDISLMRDNIRSYKRLEYEAEMIDKRVLTLENIALKYLAFHEERQRYEIQNYVIDRAKHQTVVENLIRLKDTTAGFKDKIIVLKTEQSKAMAEIAKMRSERDKLISDKRSLDVTRKKEDLDNKKAQLEKELEEIEGVLRSTTNNIRKYGVNWRTCIGELKSEPLINIKIKNANEYESISTDWITLKKYGTLALQHAKRFYEINQDRLCCITEDDFMSISTDISKFKSTASGAWHNIQQQLKRAESGREESASVLASLENGIKPYDSKLIELKNEIMTALRKKTGKALEIHILADLLEIKNQRWRNAVEAYLHTQKFYLIVGQEYFMDALAVYDQLKFQKGFFDWGIVDTSKLQSLKAVRLEGSLAEEVVTDNQHARIFIDYVMGRLMKCESLQQIRGYERAITDSCMLYQNYVARQLNPERWRFPYIGHKAIEDQVKLKKLELEELDRVISIYNSRLKLLVPINSMEIMNANEILNTLDVIAKAGGIDILKSEYASVIKELGSLDLTWFAKLEGMISEIDADIQEKEKQERDLNNQVIRLDTDVNRIEKEDIPQNEMNIANYLENINIRYKTDWVTVIGEPRFLKELDLRSSATEVYSNFYSQVLRTQSQAGKKKDELVAARSDYNRDYKMSYDINESENAAYNKELEELKIIRLPEYKKQIQDAKNKAYEQFRDDFLAKLKSSMDTVRNQIDELNGALKESSFGNDRYRFVTSPKTEYRRYYDMITDEMLMEGHNISSQIFRDKHRDAIEELFRQVTDGESEQNADSRAEIEKNISKFTDYRTYLNFDLIVTDEEDRNQRLSKTLHKKSGGETQTPFYISVLASFAQLYRIHQKNDSSNTMRLIIFDEAFSKMDSERIQESIKLLRKFGLQAIISAPPEKIGDIAPLVDRNLCAIRSADFSCVKAFDSRKLMEEDIVGL